MNIIFDLGGVVFEWAPKRVISDFFPQPDECTRIWRALIGHSDWRRFDLGTIEPEALARNTANRAGIETALMRELVESLTGSLLPKHDTISLIKRLRVAKHPVYCLSNMGRPLYEHLERTFVLRELFDECVVSYRLGMAKPDEGIYNYTVKHLRLEPARTVFFDDMEENVLGAQNVGMLASVFTDVERCVGFLRSVGVRLSE